MRDLYAKAEAVPCEGKAILAGGLPGAGKTSVLTGVAGIDLSRYLMINPDDIKEEMARRGMVPETQGLIADGGTDLVHEESSDMAKRLAIRAYSDRKNVIWDVTMSSVDSTQKRIANELRSAGYGDGEASLRRHSVDVSVRRAEARHREGHDNTWRAVVWGAESFRLNVLIRWQTRSLAASIVECSSRLSMSSFAGAYTTTRWTGARRRLADGGHSRPR